MPDFDEEKTFAQTMGDVKPLEREKRVRLSDKGVNTQSLEARRRAAQEQDSTESNMLSGEFVERVTPKSVLSFQRPGIQHGVFRNLRTGKYEMEASLDLHQHSVEQARKAINDFIFDACGYGLRNVLVSHGTGEGREEPALLKSCLAHWLPQLDAVQAFHSAQQHHGGLGATYVMLRKDTRSKG
mgnify:CR=1 FL=1